jgi:hypothetical protein
MYENKKEQITEEMKIHEEWYKDARDMTIEKLPEFLRHISEDYIHDYGTICHALASGAVATTWALERTPQGGITGFQAGAIMWEYIQNWMSEYKDKPLRLINYKDMLYPQYENKFNSISEDTWEWLQEEAKKHLDEKKEFVHPDILNHWENIVDGLVPFGMSVSKDL